MPPQAETSSQSCSRPGAVPGPLPRVVRPARSPAGVARMPRSRRRSRATMPAFLNATKTGRSLPGAASTPTPTPVTSSSARCGATGSPCAGSSSPGRARRPLPADRPAGTVVAIRDGDLVIVVFPGMVLRDSRAKVLDLGPALIIPGHGGPFAPTADTYGDLRPRGQELPFARCSGRCVDRRGARTGCTSRRRSTPMRALMRAISRSTASSPTRSGRRLSVVTGGVVVA
jgi:hypothetical protein